MDVASIHGEGKRDPRQERKRRRDGPHFPRSTYSSPGIWGGTSLFPKEKKGRSPERLRKKVSLLPKKKKKEVYYLEWGGSVTLLPQKQPKAGGL